MGTTRYGRFFGTVSLECIIVMTIRDYFRDIDENIESLTIYNDPDRFKAVVEMLSSSNNS